MSAYRSIFQKRTRPVTRDDFAGLKFLSPPDDLGSLAFWDGMIPLYPAEVERIVTQAMPVPVDIRVNADHEQFNIAFNPVDGNAFLGSATVHRDTQLDPMSSIEIWNEADKGKGIGSGWLKAFAELFVALGKPHFTLSACMDNGAYAWGKMGLALDQRPTKAPVTQKHRVILKTRIDALAPFVDEDVTKKARHYAEMKHADDPIGLSSLREPLPQELGDILGRTNTPLYLGLLEQFNKQKLPFEEPRTSATEQRHSMSTAFQAAAQNSRTPVYAQCLLARLHWPAIIDFSDMPRMEKIGNRIGGWNTIQPV